MEREGKKKEEKEEKRKRYVAGSHTEKRNVEMKRGGKGEKERNES